MLKSAVARYYSQIKTGVNGLKQKRHFRYEKDENVIELEFVREKGVSECLAKKYYDNGKIKVEKSYKNGKAEGASKLYDENGDFKVMASYEKGTMKGLWRVAKKDGNIRFEDIFTGEQETNKNIL
jgi:antitoxin component YwqK of YwqJK toxin-antitoxin module